MFSSLASEPRKWPRNWPEDPFLQVPPAPASLLLGGCSDSTFVSIKLCCWDSFLGFVNGYSLGLCSRFLFLGFVYGSVPVFCSWLCFWFHSWFCFWAPLLGSWWMIGSVRFGMRSLKYKSTPAEFKRGVGPASAEVPQSSAQFHPLLGSNFPDWRL